LWRFSGDERDSSMILVMPVQGRVNPRPNIRNVCHHAFLQGLLCIHTAFQTNEPDNDGNGWEHYCHKFHRNPDQLAL
jgi:hypothetical protein